MTIAKNIDECIQLIKNKEDCGLRGKNLYSGHTKHGYVVFSYGDHYPLCVFDNASGQWIGNETKSSPTTQRHKSRVYRELDISMMVPLPELKAIVREGLVGAVASRMQ